MKHNIVDEAEPLGKFLPEFRWRWPILSGFLLEGKGEPGKGVGESPEKGRGWVPRKGIEEKNE